MIDHFDEAEEDPRLEWEHDSEEEEEEEEKEPQEEHRHMLGNAW